MAHPPDHGFCTNGVVRLVFVLVAVCLVGYTIRPSLHWSLKEKGSCPQCPCDCSKDFDPIPVDIINSSFSDCGKHEPEVKEEMEKDIIALMSEELSLQQTVANETLQRTDALLMGARRVSLHYQKEAEKCNAGVETCEEARERAQAELVEELRLSEVWERRARELGWTDNS
ncbi:hypothetical protein PRUPE_6G331100 [Prunus persica]|uniref:Uncharacterized protein n=3 Tax=Prunus TaxID=3754 RepID=A0A5E4ECU2_PRUDU|nr:PREDICTED: uncharacterized protein LOC103344688 [Prunus mume]XP_020422033.1 uncharacterized protein LOC18772012 isoform X1 [Prunus persica]XP_034219892.1 uncharacterized protein LOC117631067 isoform X1 [Prunus dulcis]KAI5326502.1 hypothetical protein L3X38_035576 [Prunus dulcis]ONI04630.1 hypothetical protein PRUPE_6G331100 [Prunus persica]VVA12759.1 Hypothetical predicted protein [Prunus dulcis]